MITYRNIHIKIEKNFVYLINLKGTHYHQGNEYGRDLIVRTIPEGCRLSALDFAKTGVDHLYERKKMAEIEEKEYLRLKYMVF